MDWRVSQINRAIREYDSKLYAQKGYQDRIDIFRETYEFETYEMDGWILRFAKPVPHRVFSLTDNWTPWGKPVEWGIEPIVQRIRSCDLWKRDVGGEVIKQVEKKKESEERHLKNESEAFFSDNKSVFKKAFSDVNVSTLDMKKDRRYRDEKKIKPL